MLAGAERRGGRALEVERVLSTGKRPEHVEHAEPDEYLEHARHDHKHRPVQLATGVGGLDWAEVRPLICDHLGGLKSSVFVSTQHQKGVQAEKPGL